MYLNVVESLIFHIGSLAYPAAARLRQCDVQGTPGVGVQAYSRAVSHAAESARTPASRTDSPRRLYLLGRRHCRCCRRCHSPPRRPRRRRRGGPPGTAEAASHEPGFAAASLAPRRVRRAAASLAEAGNAAAGACACAALWRRAWLRGCGRSPRVARRQRRSVAAAAAAAAAQQVKASRRDAGVRAAGLRGMRIRLDRLDVAGSQRPRIFRRISHAVSLPWCASLAERRDNAAQLRSAHCPGDTR